jgi:hypothetical protein
MGKMGTTFDDKLPAFQKYLLEKNPAEAKNWRNIDKEGQTINAAPVAAGSRNYLDWLAGELAAPCEE